MSEKTELEAIADGTIILGKSRPEDVARIRQLETDLRALRAAALDILLLWENENSGELPAFWKAIARLRECMISDTLEPFVSRDDEPEEPAQSASLVNELPLPTFQKVIQATYGCPSDLRERVRFREEFQEELVWEGEVLVFDLIGHPTALTCYAWSMDSRVTAVLHEGPVDSPQAAVRAAIVEE